MSSSQPSTRTSPYTLIPLIQSVPTKIRCVAFATNRLFIGGEDGSLYMAEKMDNKFIVMKGMRVSRQPITAIHALPRSGLLMFVTTLRLGVLSMGLERVKTAGVNIVGEDCAIILTDKGPIKSRVDRFGMYSTQRTLTFIEYTKEKGFQRYMKGIMFDIVPQTIEWVGDRIYFIQGDTVKFVRLSDRVVGVLRERRGQGAMRPFVRAVGEYVAISNAESLQVVGKRGTPVDNVREVFPTLVGTLRNVVIVFPFVLCIYPDCVRIYNFFTGRLDDTVRCRTGVVSQSERDVVICERLSEGPVSLLKSIDLIQFINEYIKAGQNTVISQLLDSYSDELQTALPTISEQDLLLVRVVYGGLLLEEGKYGDAFDQFRKCVAIKTDTNATWDVRSVVAIFDDLVKPTDKFRQYAPVDWRVIEERLPDAERHSARVQVYDKLGDFLQDVQKITKYDKELETQRIKAMIAAERDDVVEEIDRDERRGWGIDTEDVLEYVKNSDNVRVLSKIYVMMKDYRSALGIWNKLAMGDDERVYSYGIEDTLSIISLLDFSNNVQLRLLRIVLNWMIPEIFSDVHYCTGDFPSIRKERNQQLEEKSTREQFTQIYLKKLTAENHHTLLSYITVPHAQLHVLNKGLSNTLIRDCKQCISTLITRAVEIMNAPEYLMTYRKQVSDTLQPLLRESSALDVDSVTETFKKHNMRNELIIIYERKNRTEDVIGVLNEMGGIKSVIEYTKDHPTYSNAVFDYTVSKQPGDLSQVIQATIDHLDLQHVCPTPRQLYSPRRC